MAAGRLDNGPVVAYPSRGDQDIDALFANLAVKPCNESVPALDQFFGCQGLGWLDKEIDVAATPRVIEAGAEQPDPRTGREAFMGRLLDGRNLLRRQSHGLTSRMGS